MILILLVLFINGSLSTNQLDNKLELGLVSTSYEQDDEEQFPPQPMTCLKCAEKITEYNLVCATITKFSSSPTVKEITTTSADCYVCTHCSAFWLDLCETKPRDPNAYQLAQFDDRVYCKCILDYLACEGNEGLSHELSPFLCDNCGKRIKLHNNTKCRRCAFRQKIGLPLAIVLVVYTCFQPLGTALGYLHHHDIGECTPSMHILNWSGIIALFLMNVAFRFFETARISNRDRDFILMMSFQFIGLEDMLLDLGCAAGAKSLLNAVIEIWMLVFICLLLPVKNVTSTFFKLNIIAATVRELFF